MFYFIVGNESNIQNPLETVKSHLGIRELGPKFGFMKSIQATDITKYHFAKSEVLPDEQSRITRMLDLNSAQAVTNLEHEEIGLIVQLENGEEIEVLSDLIDVGLVHVEVKGGHLIPITAILRVEI